MEEANTLLDTELALKPLLELASSSAHSNASMLRTVVLKAISDPKVFCGFDEIKTILQPGLSAAGVEGEVLTRTLDLFSYGTYSDYQKQIQQQPESFLTLSDTHIFKLRQLTILTLVEKACLTRSDGGGVDENAVPTTTGERMDANNKIGGCCVSYHTLAEALGFTNPIMDDTTTATATADQNHQTITKLDDAVLRQVEEIVLSCVYARVVAGQLCQKSSALFVSSRHGPPCRPRDVPVSQQGATMLATLKQFHQGRLQETKQYQDQRQQQAQAQMDNLRSYYKVVLERAREAEQLSSGAPGRSGSNAILIGGGAGGGSVRGWPAEGGQEERRMSDIGGSARGPTASRRQSKRSRGGVGGVMDSFSRY